MAYIPGDFWRICDRCGFSYRSSQTFKTWDGLYVCREDFETRHPQDFVRGRVDKQNVLGPRPDDDGPSIGPLSTETTTAAAAGATSLLVTSSSRFLTGNTIGVFGTDGNVLRMIVSSVPTTTSLTVPALRMGVPSGAVVTNYSVVSLPDIG
jgi:hypothetical protein